MRKHHVCHILRRCQLVKPTYTNRDIGTIKNIIGSSLTWREFLEYVAMIQYLSDNLPDEGVYIKELNVKYGGTLVIDLGRLK